MTVTMFVRCDGSDNRQSYGHQTLPQDVLLSLLAGENVWVLLAVVG